MTKTKQILASFLLVTLLVPFISFASWWNPFTWFEEENKTEISIEVSTSTSVVVPEIKTEIAWWNLLSWGKKETLVKQEIATTTEEIIPESEDEKVETETETQNTENEKTQLELETAKAKAEAEKYKLQAEQTRLEMEKLKQENTFQTQTQVEVKQEENKNTTVTLPNGSIVEMDEYGNIVKIIKEASVIPPETTKPIQQIDQIQNIIPKIEISEIENSLSAIPSTNQQLLIQFKITTKDIVEISKSIFKINTSSGYGEISDITSAFLVDQSGNIVAGPVNGVGDNNGIIEFTDTITLKKGMTDYKLKANIGSAFTDNPNIYVSIDVDNWEIK